MKAIVRTDNLRKTYGEGESAVEAIRGVNIAIAPGEAVAVVGASGSGKSTLLHMIGGLDRPTEGAVLVEDQPIFAQNDTELAKYRRRKIGFVFQMYNLMPQLTAYENIVLPLSLDGRDVDEAHMLELMHTLGIADQRDKLPAKMSGGQQQRVAIARALATQPAIILADEPTGNLDSHSSAEVLNLLRLSVDKFRQTLLVITHDDKVAQQCDRIIRIADGIVEEG